MEILVNLDVMMAKRKISAGELAERIGITPANLSILKNNKAKAIRFSTLMALCHELRCQPGDLLESEYSGSTRVTYARMVGAPNLRRTLTRLLPSCT